MGKKKEKKKGIAQHQGAALSSYKHKRLASLELLHDFMSTKLKHKTKDNNDYKKNPLKIK